MLCFISANSLTAQKLEGLWYSSDSTRVYEIKKAGESKYTVVIKSSTRKGDRPGFVVIKELEYNSRRKRFEGMICAVEDGAETFVKIRFTKADSNKLALKLSRMFVFDVSINWLRADT